MPAEFLSVTPQRVRCYVCGSFTESPDHWKYRLRHGGHSPVCPTCPGKVETELEEMTNHPNFAGAILLGALAAIAASAAWYGVSIIIEREYVILAVGVGWLVGKAVVLGSGNKRGLGLQVAAGVLAFIGIMGGRYLLINQFTFAGENRVVSGWLSFEQFLAINTHLLANGNGIGDLICSVIAVFYATALPRPDRLAADAPTGLQGWRRWVR